MHWTELNWTALHCTALQFNALHCTAFPFIVLHSTALYCTELLWTAPPFTALYIPFCTAYRSCNIDWQSKLLFFTLLEAPWSSFYLQTNDLNWVRQNQIAFDEDPLLLAPCRGFVCVDDCFVIPDLRLEPSPLSEELKEVEWTRVKYVSQNNHNCQYWVYRAATK